MSENPELAKRAQARETEALPVTDDIDPRLAVAAGVVARETPAAPEKSVSLLFVVTYVAAYAGTWLMLLSPVVVSLALKVTELVGATRAPANLSLVLGVGALLALFGNPFFGKLSDRTKSRFGMRRPWMIFGCVGGALGLLVVALAPNIAIVLVGWCIAQLAFNGLLAALVAVLADQVPERQRGTVAGALGICLSLGLIGGTFLVQAVVGHNVRIFMVPTAVGVALVVLFVLVLKDRRLDPAQKFPPYNLGEFVRSFWINPARYPDFAWAWASRWLFFAGWSFLTTYQAFYLLNKLHLDTGLVARTVFFGTLVQNVVVIAISIFGGRASDMLGRRKVFVLSAALVYGVALVVVALSNHVNGYLVGMAIGGLGFGVYLAVDLALVTDVLPNRTTDAAKGLGVFNIASAMPQSVAPAVAPAILFLGHGDYSVLFVVAGVVTAIGALAIVPVRGVR
jgi:MFS family permease